MGLGEACSAAAPAVALELTAAWCAAALAEDTCERNEGSLSPTIFLLGIGGKARPNRRGRLL